MNNNNKVQKLAALVAMVAITAIILFNNAVLTQKVSAIYEDEVAQFIAYKDLAPNQQNQEYIGYHLTNDHVFLWYKNNNNSGFVLDQFLTEQQQKIQDETGIRQ